MNCDAKMLQTNWMTAVNEYSTKYRLLSNNVNQSCHLIYQHLPLCILMSILCYKIIAMFKKLYKA